MDKQQLDLIYDNFKANGLNHDFYHGEKGDILVDIRDYGIDTIKDMGYYVEDYGLLYSLYIRANNFKYGFVGRKSDHRYDEYTLWIIKPTKPDTIIYVKSWYIKK